MNNIFNELFSTATLEYSEYPVCIAFVHLDRVNVRGYIPRLIRADVN